MSDIFEQAKTSFEKEEYIEVVDLLEPIVSSEEATMEERILYSKATAIMDIESCEDEIKNPDNCSEEEYGEAKVIYEEGIFISKILDIYENNDMQEKQEEYDKALSEYVEQIVLYSSADDFATNIYRVEQIKYFANYYNVRIKVFEILIELFSGSSDDADKILTYIEEYLAPLACSFLCVCGDFDKAYEIITSQKKEGEYIADIDTKPIYAIKNYTIEQIDFWLNFYEVYNGLIKQNKEKFTSGPEGDFCEVTTGLCNILRKKILDLNAISMYEGNPRRFYLMDKICYDCIIAEFDKLLKETEDQLILIKKLKRDYEEKISQQAKKEESTDIKAEESEKEIEEAKQSNIKIEENKKEAEEIEQTKRKNKIKNAVGIILIIVGAVLTGTILPVGLIMLIAGIIIVLPKKKK